LNHNILLDPLFILGYRHIILLLLLDLLFSGDLVKINIVILLVYFAFYLIYFLI